MEVDYFVMNKLKEIRKRSNLTQKELSQRSGVSLRTLQDYEQGNKKLMSANAATVFKFAIVLGVNGEDLIDYDNLREHYIQNLIPLINKKIPTYKDDDIKKEDDIKYLIKKYHLTYDEAVFLHKNLISKQKETD